MKEIIQNILFALGAVLLFFGMKAHIVTYAEQHPNVIMFIGLALIIGASKIAGFISQKLKA